MVWDYENEKLTGFWRWRYFTKLELLCYFNPLLDKLRKVFMIIIIFRLLLWERGKPRKSYLSNVPAKTLFCRSNFYTTNLWKHYPNTLNEFGQIRTAGEPANYWPDYVDVLNTCQSTNSKEMQIRKSFFFFFFVVRAAVGKYGHKDFMQIYVEF